jgi:DNA-binding GntR family transcriptional regulator
MAVTSAALSIQPIQKRSAEQLAVVELRRLIVAGVLPAGERLTEVGLAEQLQLARATVRVALHQLSTEGLVSLVPYTGWSVASLTPDDAWEIFTLRSCIEGLAARLATERLAAESDGAGRKKIETAFAALVSACQQHPDQIAAPHIAAPLIAECDFDLHRTIVQLSGHSRLAYQYRQLESQVRMYIASSDALITDPGIIVAQHQPIIEAVIAGRADEAAALATQHNLSEGEVLVRHLRKRAFEAGAIPQRQ